MGMSVNSITRIRVEIIGKMLSVALLSLLPIGFINAQELFAPAAPSAPGLIPPQCRTVSGQTRGELCQFPFGYRGKIYTECTYEDTVDNQAWCATRVGRDGITAVRTSYGNCATNFCPIENRECRPVSGPDAGNTCKFPFIYRGKTYNSCADWVWGGRNHGEKWCSTRTNRRGRHVNGRGFYGICGNCQGPLLFGGSFDAPGAPPSLGAAPGAPGVPVDPLPGAPVGEAAAFFEEAAEEGLGDAPN